MIYYENRDNKTFKYYAVIFNGKQIRENLEKRCYEIRASPQVFLKQFHKNFRKTLQTL